MLNLLFKWRHHLCVISQITVIQGGLNSGHSGISCINRLGLCADEVVQIHEKLFEFLFVEVSVACWRLLLVVRVKKIWSHSKYVASRVEPYLIHTSWNSAQSFAMDVTYNGLGYGREVRLDLTCGDVIDERNRIGLGSFCQRILINNFNVRTSQNLTNNNFWPECTKQWTSRRINFSFSTSTDESCEFSTNFKLKFATFSNNIHSNIQTE